MFFFHINKRFKQPLESRVIPGYFLFLITISCGTKKQPSSEIRIAKTIPANYINVSDKNFIKHKDTLYYQAKYFTGYLFSIYSLGDTAFIGGYFNGVEEGLHRKWYPNKQMAEERFYINGKKEGTHRGWWPDGKPKFVFSAVNNENEGEFKEWNASGLLYKKFHYVNGQEEGSQQLWWDNGAVRANYVIRNGKKYGFIGLKTCVNPYDSIVKK